METGRGMFDKFRMIILLLTFFISLLPYKIRLILWEVINYFPGKIGIGLRYITLSSLTKKCGDNVYIGKGVTINNFSELIIGKNVSIHNNCYIDAIGSIHIGNNVSIAHNSSIISFDHTWENLTVPIKYNPLKLKEVRINDDVWVGCGCRILSGVEIKSRTIIAAGSVVNKMVKSNQIIAGVPGVKIKNI